MKKKQKNVSAKRVSIKKYTEKKVIIFSLLALLLVASVYGGFKYIQRKNLVARAAGWSNIVYLPTSNNANPLQVMACKKDAGPLWSISVFAYNGSSSYRSGSVGIYRNGTAQSSKTISLVTKQQAFYHFYASKIAYDTVLATFGTTGTATVSGLKDC